MTWKAYASYNSSEFRAFKSGKGLSDYLASLRQRYPDYTISVAAHSMGNIVVMEALKDDLALGRQSIDNLVLMQAAVPAHCFDTSLSGYEPFTKPPFTPDTYRGYPGAINAAVRNKIVNFFNVNDFALATGKVIEGTVDANWEANQLKYKPDTDLGYRTDGVTSSQYNVSFSEPRQIMSFVSKPRSKAVGAQPDVAGVTYMPGQIDLNSRFSFDRQMDEHSAQFNWDIQRVNGFYTSLIGSLFPLP